MPHDKHERRRFARGVISDLFILGGAGSIVYGAHMISTPAAVVAVGILLLATGLKAAPR